MRCDQCRHWNEQDKHDWEAAGVGFGECKRIRERWVITDKATKGIEWDSKDTSPYVTKRREALLAARAYVQDGSEYRAELFTRPDFFCALFEPR
jgi:hypothetical protein